MSDSTRNNSTSSDTPQLAAGEFHSVGMKSEELASKVSGFHEMMANRNPVFASTARELYDLLIRPAGQQLSGFTTICIVPDGYLWDVPFQALMSGDGRYLLEDHALYYVPSLTVLREMGRPKSGDVNNVKHSLIAYGNPVIGKENVSGQGEGSELCPLPEAEAEVTSLAQKYSATGSKALIGREATEKSFKTAAPAFGMIHLATYGVLDNRHPLYSYLLLTKTDGEVENDGLLEAVIRSTGPASCWSGVTTDAITSTTTAADETHPLQTEEEATEVVEYLWRLEREQVTGSWR